MFDPVSFYAMEAWRRHYNMVLWLPVHAEIIVPKLGLPHPSEAGFVLGPGEPVGQMANYLLALSDGRQIDVKEFLDHYTLHWDHRSATLDPLGHLAQDAPHWIPIFGVGALALLLVVAALGSE